MQVKTVLLPAAIVCVATFTGCRSAEPDHAEAEEALRLNHIQVVGSHNSYKPGLYPGMFALIAQDDSALAASLEYDHLPLQAQLDVGLRSLELDVFHDPEGGRFALPAGLDALARAGLPVEVAFDSAGLLGEPGFKVFHVQDIDFLSHCLLLRVCLEQIRDWSDAHPDHVPIVITVNAKDQPIDRPGFAEPVPFDAEAFDALDRAILDVFPVELLVRPDDVRGEAQSLNEAILKNGWPALEEIRGRVLFVLDESGPKRDVYLNGHPSLEGRVFFANAPAGTPASAVIIANDPVEDAARIRSLVETGYLVRTRADADTWEARSRDTVRRDAAFASGAHVVTTDYYLEDPRFGSGYRVVLPGDEPARCNPVSAPAFCRQDALEPQ